MADFQNCRISGIFGVCSCGFLHITTLLFLWNSFSHVFDIISDPNRPFWRGYSLCIAYSLCNMTDFQNCRISRIFGVFSRGFLKSTTLFSCRKVFRIFMAFLILDQNRPFYKGYSLCMGYSLCKMALFQNCRISRIFGVCSCGFLHRTTLMFLWNRFSHVFGIFNFGPKLTILQRL